MFRLGRSREVRRRDTNVLLQMLDSVLGAMPKSVETGSVEVVCGTMAVGQKCAGGDCMVRRESLERIGQHFCNLGVVVPDRCPCSIRGSVLVLDHLRDLGAVCDF